MNAPELVITAAPLIGRLGETRQDFRGVEQFLQRLDAHDRFVRDQRAHHRVIADHGAGMGARRFLRAGAAAGMHQHDRLFARAGARRELKK